MILILMAIYFLFAYVHARKTQKIHRFAVKICLKEKGASQVNIAQMMETLSVINKQTFGLFYWLIRLFWWSR